MDILFLIGRILFGGYFIYSGVMHFSRLGMLSGYTASKGVSLPKVAVLVTGVLIFLGGLGILLGVYVRWSVLFLAVFLIPVTFIMHAFWRETDPNARMTQMQMFFKNLVMLGGALMLLAIPEPWVWSAW